MSDVLIRKPEKCHLWQSPLTKEMVQTAFEIVKAYRNDYHNSRDLLRCKTCGQLYFSEFYEEVDFSGDDDRQYYSFIPIDKIETADKLLHLSRFQLAGLLGIFMSFPPHDAKPHWRNAK